VEAIGKGLEQRVREAIESRDEIRQDLHGGCGWSQWRLQDGVVYVATTSHDNEPQLVVLPVSEFLAQWEVRDDDEDDEE
jgi:hypothetical protein